MFAFAFVAGGRDSERPSQLEAMLRAWPAAPPDGEAVAAAPHAVAGIRRWEVVKRDARVVPHWDEEQRLLTAGDVRLYNRNELKTLLEVPAAEDPTDLELARGAYRRWGRECPRHLIGDFAFVVWDDRARSLFAARDQIGVRPLYYRVGAQGLYVGSDVRQLLPTVANPIDSIDPRKMLERMCRHFCTHGLTYFSGISFLRPGHYLLVDDGKAHETRYWLPQPRGPIARSYEDECAELRALFRRAVEDRLDSDRPVVAHSSGGFDSSSIVMVADQLYRDRPQRPPLVTTAATVHGMPCDDSPYMDAVTRATQFENVRWSAFEDNFEDIESPSVSHPGEKRGPGGGPRTDVALARARGARALISGILGDGVLFAWAILRDLFRAGRFRQVVEETATTYAPLRLWRGFLKSSLGLLPPRLALAILNQRAARVGSPPEWLGPALRAIYPPPPEALDPPAIAWPSHMACETWARLTSPQTAFHVDSMMRYGAEDGIEVRMPFADVRLIEFILQIPWEHRVPRGDMRRLGRDALGGLLPKEFNQRLDQGSALPVLGLAARRILPGVRKIVNSGAWLSEPYVDRRVAARMIDDCLQRGEAADPRTSVTAMDFGVIEAWLRRVSGYDMRPEVRR
jgi:asparagine synthase (glutamine-hydrolysing)